MFGTSCCWHVGAQYWSQWFLTSVVAALRVPAAHWTSSAGCLVADTWGYSVLEVAAGIAPLVFHEELVLFSSVVLASRRVCRELGSFRAQRVFWKVASSRLAFFQMLCGDPRTHGARCYVDCLYQRQFSSWPRTQPAGIQLCDVARFCCHPRDMLHRAGKSCMPSVYGIAACPCREAH